MAHTKTRIISIIVAAIMTVTVAGFPMPAKAESKETKQITGKYDDFSNIADLKLNGAASVQSEGTQPAIRLIDNKQWQNGSFYYGNYVSLANDRSFSTMFSFKVTNPQSGTSGADGITFLLNTHTNNPGAVGGGMGYSGIINSLGIEFDTWDNANLNGDAGLYPNHIAVNINGYTEHPLATVKESEIEAILGTPAGTYNFGNGTSNGNKAPAVGSEKTYYSWIDYDGMNKTLTVRINANSNVRPDKAVITQQVDLGNATTLTSDKVYAGFTGATGVCYSKEYVKSWYFNNDYLPTSIDVNKYDYYEAPKITLTADPSTDATTSKITAVVKDHKGAVVAGVPVTFSILYGAAAKFTSPETVTTDANGVATAMLDGSNIPKGQITVDGAIDVANGGNNGTVTINNFGKATIVPTISDSTITAKKNSTCQLTSNDFTSHYTGGLNDIKIISLPVSTSGVLKNNGTVVKVGDVIPATALNLLTLSIPYGAANTASLQWQASSNGTDFSNTATITFNLAANHVPVASDIAVSTKLKTPVSGTTVATDADNDNLYYQVTSTPIQGTVSVNSTTGAWKYTPNASASGLDSFNVTVTDGFGGTATSNVLVTISDTLSAPPTTTDPSTGVMYESKFDDKTGVVTTKGNWQIASNGLKPNNGTENRVILDNTDATNYEITADATATGTGGGYGIIYHATKLQNLSGYVFQFDKSASNSFLVRKFTNGTENMTALKSVPMKSVMGDAFDLNAKHRIVIHVKDNEHVITVDGVEVLRFTDSTFTSGYVGLRSWQNIDAAFSYVKVVNLDTKTVKPITIPKIDFSYAYLYGYSDSLAAADESLTRAEVSTILYRILKQSGATTGFTRPSTPTYSDVPDSSWAYCALEYMTSIGAISGKDGMIYPDEKITRGEMAKIMCIAMGIKPNGSYSNSFTDTTASNQYYDYIMSLAEVNVLSGYPDGTMHPNSVLTRAEYVCMVNTLLGRNDRYYVDDQKSPYPDIDSSHWAYKEILRASFGFSDKADADGYYKVDAAKKLSRSTLDYD